VPVLRTMLNVFLVVYVTTSGKISHSKVQVKVCMECTKRIDPSLPFYYYTSAHHRFHEGELNKPGSSMRKLRLKRVPQREQIATLVPGRVTLPVRGSLSVRPQFHNRPLDLPPPPSAPLHIFEHAYARHH
jgi:hypothetical protein